MGKRDNVLQIEATQSFEEGATFALQDGGIYLSVSEEQAVDSYNKSFTCSLHMTREQSIELRDWLNTNFKG